MFEKPTATHALGLQKEGGGLLGAALSYIKNQPRLESLFKIQFSVGNDEHVKLLYNEGEEKKLNEALQQKLVATSLAPNEVLFRSLEVKLKKIKDIEAVLPFQAEPLLPYPVENSIIDRIILSQTTDGTQIAIAATRKDNIEAHLKEWKEFGIDPEVITASPAALAEFAKLFVKTTEPLFILHLGTANSICVLVNEGKLQAAQGVNIGLHYLAEAASNDNNSGEAAARLELSQMNFNLPLRDNSPALSNAIDTLRMEITKTFYALSKAVKGKDVSGILITGEGGAIKGFPELVIRNLNKTVVLPSETPFFQASTEDLQKFAIPIGTALSVLPKSSDALNFRQQEFVYPKPWKRLKKPLAIYLAVCGFITFALFLAGQAYIAHEESNLKTQYLELLNVMNKPYSQFEREYAAKFPDDPPHPENEVPPVNSLSDDNLLRRLQYLEKEIKATPQSYPLKPNIPLVSDVLAWLSTHPNFVGKKTEGEEGVQSLQLESFNYTLVKRPELTKKQEKYQVKVELEFSSPNPKMAREFHDALIAANDIVDNKAEIKWSSNRDKYRATFYLKDKTVYPTP